MPTPTEFLLQKRQAGQPVDFSVGQTIKNIPASGFRLLKDVATTVRHPIETVKNLGQVAMGGIEKLTPGRQAEEEKFENVAGFFKERYGGIENIKRTIQEDPVGFLADVSAVLTGGGALTKVGILRKAGLALEPTTLGMKTVGAVTKPFRKVGGALVREALGVSTGTSGTIIREAFRNPTKEFVNALRGKTTVDNLLTGARDALQTIRDERAATYQARLAKIQELGMRRLGGKKTTGFRGNRIPLDDFKDFINTERRKFRVARKADGTYDMSRSPIADTGEQNRVREMLETIDAWDDNTPAGLDILKQRLDDFYTPSGRGRALVSSIRNKLKNTLNEKVEGYFEMTKDYAETTELIKEIENTLSLKKGKGIDTTIRKLTSSLRQNNEYREALVRKLDELTQRDLVPSLAGAALSPGVPAGLVGRSIFAGGLAGGLAGAFGLAAVSPQVLFGLAITSPRVVGEFLRVLGMGNKAVQSVLEFANSPMGKEILQMQFQAGRAERISE